MMKYHSISNILQSINQKPICSLSIIIPCHNEGGIIFNTIKKIRTLKKDFPDLEIIVCEDGSSDSTVSVLSLLEDMYPEIRWLHSEKKMGKGEAIMQGMCTARGKIICFMDADLSADLKHTTEFYKKISDGFDIVIGSRTSHAKRSLTRIISSKIFNSLVRLLFQTNIKDHQCGFKVMKKSCTVKLLPLMRNTDFIFDAELIIKAQSIGLKIKELPVLWTEPKDRESKINVRKEGYRMGKALLKLKFSSTSSN